MQKIPAHFKALIEILARHADLRRHGWTSLQQRYYFAVFCNHGSDRTSFCKMTRVNQTDIDDESTVAGLQRVVWFYRVLEAIHRRGEIDLPFWTPTVRDQNVMNNGHSTATPFVAMRYLEGGPICPELPEMGASMDNFRRLCEVMSDCHHALQQITPATVSQTDAQLIFPPTLPHESLGWRNKFLVELLRCSPKVLRGIWRSRLAALQKSAQLKMERCPNDYVLDPGAFERKNFYQPERAGFSTEIIDTEFAGWSRRQHTLAKAFIRLWAGDQRPDLARMLLRTYTDRYNVRLDSDFYTDLTRELESMIHWGNFFDTFRRGHISRSYCAHQLRKQLRQILEKRSYVDLLTSAE